MVKENGRLIDLGLFELPRLAAVAAVRPSATPAAAPRSRGRGGAADGRLGGCAAVPCDDDE